MNHEIDISKYKIRTDLIIESIKNYKNIPGIKESVKTIDNIQVVEVKIEENMEDIFNKKKGIYKTIIFDDITDTTNRKKVEEVFTSELLNLFNSLSIDKNKTCLVVGLGNERSTPDALGPKVIENIFVTRHLFLLEGSNIEEGFRNVSAFSPNVMGSTGIESKDFILGLINRVKPDFIIIVDALASSSINRVNKTIQMTDSGIAPGSGVGNARDEISKETVGIPVIAIGVPTIVDAVTIVNDTFEYLVKQVSYNKEQLNNHKSKLIPAYKRNYLTHNKTLTNEEKTKLLGLLGNLSLEERKSLIFEVLSPIGYNLMVTPKEVDFVIDKLSLLLSTGINRCLHEKYNKTKK